MQILILAILVTRTSLENISFIGAALNAVVIVLGLLCVIRVRSSLKKLVMITWLPYIIFLAYSITYSSSRGDGVRLVLQTCTYPSIVFCIFYVCRTATSIFSVLVACVASAVVPALFGLVQAATGTGGDRVVKGTFSHPNILAFYIVCMMLVIYMLLQILPEARSRVGESVRRRRHIVNILARGQFFSLATKIFSMVLLVLLVATETRSAWVSFGATLFIMSVFVERRGLFALALVPFLLILPPVQERILDVVNVKSDDVSMADVGSGRVIADSYTWRKLLWAAALEDSADARLSGKGAGSFNSGTEEFFPISPDMDAHSAYIQTIYELGYVGLALYIMTMAVPLLYAWTKRRANPKIGWAVMANVIAYAIAGYSDNTIYYLTFNWYFLTTTSAGLALLTLDYRQRSRNPRTLRTSRPAGKAMPMPSRAQRGRPLPWKGATRELCPHLSLD